MRGVQGMAGLQMLVEVDTADITTQIRELQAVKKSYIRKYASKMSM
jgi:hypothetical protein